MYWNIEDENGELVGCNHPDERGAQSELEAFQSAYPEGCYRVVKVISPYVAKTVHHW